ncbi:hypothetical protein [Thalassotalea fusca]
MNSSKITHFSLIAIIGLFITGCGGGGESGNNQAAPQVPDIGNDAIMITVSAPESDADIYLS